MVKVVIAVMLLVSIAACQEAKVIAQGVEAVRVAQPGKLSPGSDERLLGRVLGAIRIAEDQAKAQQLHDAQQAAEKAFEEFKHEVAHKYLAVSKGNPDAGTWSIDRNDHDVYRQGWAWGFTFSTNFTFIVPETYGSVQGCREAAQDGTAAAERF